MAAAKVGLAADPASLLTTFAERIATHNDPPPPDPRRFDPARMKARFGAAAAQRLGVRHARRRRSLGRLGRLLRVFFIEHPRRTRTKLAEALGFTPNAAADLAMLLVEAGLLDHGWDNGRWHWYGLSRAGEDWALPIVQDEAPPAP